MRWSWIAILTVFLAGCATSYTTPGGAADFSTLGVSATQRAALTDASVRSELDKKPLATFPVALALVRVQAGDYTSYSYRRNNPQATGAYSVITIRDVEKDEDFDALARLPRLAGIVPLKRILLDKTLNTDLELRAASARLHAGMLLFYTFDTQFQTDYHGRPLGVITLGLFPTHVERVTCTASAVLMDVANGYVYAAVEATSNDDQLANAWTSDQAVEEIRRRVERKAFVDMINQFKTEWPNVVATYDRPTATQ